MKVAHAGLIVGAVLVAAVGLVAQKAAGAPGSALGVQTAGLVIGGTVGVGLALSGWRPGFRTALAVAVLAVAALLATFTDPGAAVAQRWIRLGPITIQPSVIVLPFVVWAWSRVRGTWSLSGLVGAVALLMAAQPDTAGCGGLFLALVGTGLARRSVSPSEGATILIALAAASWAATRPDDLPAVAHVERVVIEAFAANPIAGVAAALATIAVPGLIAWQARLVTPETAATAFALTGLWLGLTAAALVANYPVPVVGYGASSAIGWLVSLGICLQSRSPDWPRWSISPRRR